MKGVAGAALREKPCSSRRARVGADREDGSVTLLLVVAVLALFAAVGLVVDGAGKIRALQRADDVAAEAARAAGQAVGASAVQGRPGVLDTTRAAQAARAYLRAAGVTGDVQVRGATVRVTTTVTFRPVLLGAAGVGPVTLTGSAQARLAQGVDREQP